MRSRAPAQSMFEEFGEITGMWWLFLITGIVWVIIALVVLRFDTISLATDGVPLGAMFSPRWPNEFMIWTVRRSWRWAHFVLGVIFVIAAIGAFATPYSAFWALASILGFWASQQFFPARAALILIWVGLMALFRGISEIVLAFQVRRLHATAT